MKTKIYLSFVWSAISYLGCLKEHQHLLSHRTLNNSFLVETRIACAGCRQTEDIEREQLHAWKDPIWVKQEVHVTGSEFVCWRKPSLNGWECSSYYMEQYLCPDMMEENVTMDNNRTLKTLELSKLIVPKIYLEACSRWRYPQSLPEDSEMLWPRI